MAVILVSGSLAFGLSLLLVAVVLPLVDAQQKGYFELEHDSQC
jgi:hypothetical protein